MKHFVNLRRKDCVFNVMVSNRCLHVEWVRSTLNKNGSVGSLPIGYFVKWIQWNSFLSFFRGWSSFLFASCRCLSAGKGPHIFERRGGFQIGQFVVSAICSFWRRTLLSLSVFPRPFFAAFLDVSCTSTRHCLSSIRLGAWFMDRGFLELAKGVQTSVDSP